MSKPVENPSGFCYPVLQNEKEVVQKFRQDIYNVTFDNLIWQYKRQAIIDFLSQQFLTLSILCYSWIIKI